VATFAEAGAYAEDPAFLRQVKVALMVAGGTVAIEDRSQYTDTTMFGMRRTLAVNVLQDPDRWARIFASIVMYDARVRAAAAPPTDGTPRVPVDDFLLSGIIYWTWNAVAGAGPAITPPPVTPPPPTPPPPDTPPDTPPPDQPPPPDVPVGITLVAHPVTGVTRFLGAPSGDPLNLRTEGGEEQVQLRSPVPPPGAPRGWPGMSPWEQQGVATPQ
jgi:hypothetical protein